MKSYILKIGRYFSEVWGEVKPREGKVSWPTQEEVKESTWLIIVTVGLVAIYLGVIDLLVGYIVTWLLGVGQ